MSFNRSFTIENNIIKGQETVYNIYEKSIGELIFNVLNNNPDHTGQIIAETGKQLTYADIKKSSVLLALWLKKQDIGFNDAVLICSPNHQHIINLMSAIYYIGAIYSTCSHELNLNAARGYITKVKPKIIFSFEKKIDILSEAIRLENLPIKIVSFDSYPGVQSIDDLLKIPCSDEEIQNFKVVKIDNPNDQVGFIVFSSGTTGAPKAIAYSYENLLKRTLSPDLDTDIEKPDNCFLSSLLPSSAACNWFILNAYRKKQTEIIYPTFNPKETCCIIEKYKVSHLAVHTIRLFDLLQENADKKYSFDSVQMIYPLGAKVTLSAWNETRKIFPNAFLHTMLGSSETGIVTMYTKKCKNPFSVGTAAYNVQFKILDFNTKKNLGPNVKGELCVKTPTPMMGYFKDPELTKSYFDEEGWYHIKDIAYYDENGELVLSSRLNDIIKYRDIYIIPSNIEDLLEAHPEVLHAAVVPVPDPKDNERPLAFVQKASGSKVTEEELAKLTYNHDYNKITKEQIKFIDEMPRSLVGKINRQLLQEMAKKSNESNVL